MTTHEQVAQDLPLYALGTLTDDDRRSVEEHLQECSRCRFELHLLREDMNRLSLTGPEIPPLHPRTAVRELPPMITLDQVEPAPRSTRLYWLAAMPVVLCIALGAMVVQLRTQNIELSGQTAMLQSEVARERTTSEHARMTDSIVKDSASTHMAAVKGEESLQVIYNANLHRAVVVGSHLTRPNSTQVYQLWLVANDGRAVSGGTFVPDADGDAFLLTQPLPRDLQTASFEVTAEIQGGVATPSTLPIFSGK